MTVRTWPERRPPTAAELVELARDAHGLLCLHTERIDGDFLRSCPNLVAVSTLGVGFEHLDLDALAAEGVVAGNTPGVLEDATADMAWALILAAARQVVQADRFVRDGLWLFPDLDMFVGPDLAGATLGIVGYGRIGRAVARRSGGFRMRVLHYDVQAVDDGGLSTPCDLDELAERSDVVTVHTSFTEQTRHLIGDKFFARMQKHAIFVNASRGAIVDQVALVRALSEGRIFGAGLDVQAVEPVPSGDVLLSLPNCIVMPHIASASFGARRAMAELAVDNLVAALQGRPMATQLVPA
jgi:glyoxylate reductase